MISTLYTTCHAH